ncbi:hypothetical protein DFA_00856 [Cavenderia fasciculata]|uniref:COMM domain-containing protein n=1 Tax=Cavenderia fasciculata TaxID=261658 RepID=F4PU61_CACFS|nr:uncharacterized protein DFA_00856 [Cavenderia fasciculata]EGG20987.1 hypothetical protein DFA_00856 [Cavenderia fasciculata]|eukprot:XP_004358837.1 hypothetical protein DFA_00856 [Cavenderia fasciculata]
MSNTNTSSPPLTASTATCSLPRMIDTDWRMDVKTSSDVMNRMAVPTVLFKIEVCYCFIIRISAITHMFQVLTHSLIDSFIQVEDSQKINDPSSVDEKKTKTVIFELNKQTINTILIWLHTWMSNNGSFE